MERGHYAERTRRQPLRVVDHQSERLPLGQHGDRRHKIRTERIGPSQGRGWCVKAFEQGWVGTLSRIECTVPNDGDEELAERVESPNGDG